MSKWEEHQALILYRLDEQKDYLDKLDQKLDSNLDTIRTDIAVLKTKDKMLPGPKFWGALTILITTLTGLINYIIKAL